MDYAAFLYLNPELCLARNIHTVENARAYADALPAAERAGLAADLGVVPDEFDPRVYIADAGTRLDVSRLDRAIRAQAVMEGLTPEQVEGNGEYADNIVQDVRLTGRFGREYSFSYDDFLDDTDVAVGDTVRLLVDDSDYHAMTVEAVDYNAKNIRLRPKSRASPPDTAARFRLYSVLVSDLRRVAVINYVRRATGRTARHELDPEFNLRLYRLLYPDARLLQRDTAYVDYLGRQNTEDFRVGKESDLLVNKEGAVLPPITVEALDVQGPAGFGGPAEFADTADFASTATFQDNVVAEKELDVHGATALRDDLRVSSNVDVLGSTSIREDLSVAGSTRLGGPVTLDDDLVVGSNLTVKRDAYVHSNLRVGNGLDVEGRAALSNTLDVLEETRLHDSLDVAGAAVMHSEVSMSNTLDVLKETRLHDSLDVTGAAVMKSNVDVIGETRLRDSLDVTGAATLSNTLEVLSSADIHGETTVRDTLDVVGETRMHNTLDVQGEATLSNTLDVIGETVMHNTLDVQGEATLSNTLDVIGETVMRNTLDVEGEVTLSNTLDVIGETVMHNTLDVQGEATLSNTLDVIGETVMHNTLDVQGEATLSNTLDVIGETVMRSTVDVEGEVTLSNTLDVIGETVMRSTVDVEGEVTLSNTLDVIGETVMRNTLDVEGEVTLSNTLDVIGETVMRSTVDVEGEVTLSNTLDVIGETVMRSTVDVEGEVTLSNTLDVIGETVMRSTVDVEGEVTLSNTLDVIGETVMRSTVDVEGEVTLSNTLDVIGETVMRSSVDVEGEVTLSNTLDVIGETVMRSTVDVEGEVTLSNTLDVIGETVMRSTVDVEGEVTLSNTLDVIGQTVMRSTVDVEGEVTLSNTLDVIGETVMRSTVDVEGEVTLSNTLDVIGQTVMRSTVDVEGEVTLSNTLDVIGETVMRSTVDVEGEVTLSNTLDVIGETVMRSTVDVEGEVSLSNTLDVVGETVLRSTVDVEGEVTLSNTLDVVGETVLRSTVDVEGEVTLSNTLDVIGETVMRSTVDVEGEVTLSNTLDVIGQTVMRSTVDVEGEVTLSNTLDVVGETVLRSTVDVEGEVTLSNTLDVVGETVLRSTVDVEGEVTLSNTLDVVGETVLRSTVDVEGEVTLSNTLDVIGQTVLRSSVDVEGEVTLSNTLDVIGQTVLRSSVDVEGEVTLSNTLDVVGQTVLRSSVDVEGEVTLSNTLDVAGEALMRSSVDVEGEVTLSNTLEVLRETVLRSSVDVEGDVTLSNGLDVVGPATMRDVRVSGTTVFDSNVVFNAGLQMDTSAPMEVGGGMDVEGLATFSNELDVQGPATMCNDLAVHGGVTLRGPLEARGDAAFSNASFSNVFVQDSLVIPAGTTDDRPPPVVGSIRYNYDVGAYEGFTDTAAGWSSLGGAVDGDRDTFISVEDYPGANDNTLRFYTSNVERMAITEDGRVVFGGDPAAHADTDCDYVFDGKACFCNVSVAGNLALGDIDDVSKHLEDIMAVMHDRDPPYVEDFAVFRIDGTSNLGGAVAVEEAGDFRVYAYATLPGAATFGDANLVKRFYNKQLLAGNAHAFFVSDVINTAPPNTLMTVSNIDVGMYFDHTDTVAPAAPKVMENYTEYQMHLMVEDVLGRKTHLRRFATPMVTVLRTHDVIAPVVAASNALAVNVSSPADIGQGRIRVDIRGISDDGIANANNPPGVGVRNSVGAYVVALDRFQRFDDVHDAFRLLDAGCNIPQQSLSNYLDSGASFELATYYTRLGPGEYSAEKTMSNFRYYAPHILLQDDYDPPNRRLLRLPDTVTLDEVTPVAGAAQKPFADHAKHGKHEMVYEMTDIVDDTRTLYYTWLMPGAHRFVSGAAASNFAAARGAALIPARELQPFQNLEFQAPFDTGEIRLDHHFGVDGARHAALDEYTQYRAHSLLVDASNNFTYVEHPPEFTRDITPPALDAGAFSSLQTVRAVGAGNVVSSVVRVQDFDMLETYHDYRVYLFSFDASPPDEDTIKRRIRDGVYQPAHYSVTPPLSASNAHAVALEFDGVVSTGEAPAVAPLAHGTVCHPVVFALDEAPRDDIPLENGNAARRATAHVSSTPSEASGLPTVTIDMEPPQLRGFTAQQSNVFDATSPDHGIGHPLVRLQFELEDRHPLQAWLYYTTSAADAAVMQGAGAADLLVDPATHGGMPSDGKFTDRFEVTAHNGGAAFEIHQPIHENLRYYFFLGTRDHHNNRAIYRSTPPSLYITPRDPVVVSYTFDVRDSLGYIAAAASEPARRPALSNTLDVTFQAQDRGRGRLDRVFLYYTTDPDEAPDAPTVCNLATQLHGAAADGALTGGRVWTTPAADADSQSHVTAKLPETSLLHLHAAAIDGYGNYSAVVRDDLLSALTAHGGLTYDTTLPRLQGLSAALKPRDIATEDTRADLVFSASDAGGATTAKHYLYYTTQDTQLDPVDVRARAIATTPGATEGGYELDYSASSAALETSAVTTPHLREWTRFWVYAACEDADGNMSVEPSGHAHKAQMTGNDAYTGSGGAADARTWDYQYPVVTQLDVSLRVDNTVRLTYAAHDNGDAEPDSGLAYVYLYYTDSAAAVSVDDVAALARSTVPLTNAGGHVLDLTLENYPRSVTAREYITPSLAESTAFYFHCVAEDRQGNRTFTKSGGSLSSASVVRPIPIHGGITYDITHGAATMTPNAEAYFTDVSPDVNNYVVNVDYSVTGPTAGGAPLDKVYLFYTMTPAAYDGLQVKQNAQLSSTSSSGTFRIPGTTLTGAGSFSRWYFYIVAYDTDTELVRTGSLNPAEASAVARPGWKPPVASAGIRDNGGVAYDLTPPTMEIV